MTQNDVEEEDEPAIKHGISGLGQKIIGEIEAMAGVINADPLAQAEGEFNVEVGSVREEIEDELERGKHRKP